MDYKISKYVYPFISEKGLYYIYNSRTNALLQVNKEIYELVYKKQTSSEELKDVSDSITEHLIRLKIITTEEDERNYISSLQLMQNLETYSTNKLILVIAPTMFCNLNCPYCFEKNKVKKVMSDETINDLIKFIKDFKNITLLHLVWYGGEPLLAISVIEKILNKIKEELPTLEFSYHFLITNGYLINNRAIELFTKYPLNEIQITLDGMKETHDEKRKLKGSSKGTFDKILLNIDRVITELPNTRISIRINIDKKNAIDFKVLRNSLQERWKNRENINIYPGILRIEDETNKCMGCEALLHDDIRELFYDLKEDVSFYPRLQHKGCGATHVNSYVIGASGEMYKCWNDVGDESKIVGYINKKELTNANMFNKYVISSSCFEDQECKECFFLPICMGGCAWYKMRNIFENANFDVCSLYKGEGVLEKCLNLHLQKKYAETK